MRPTGPQMSVQKGRSDEDGERGESGVAAVDVRFDVVGGDDFKQDKDTKDFSGVTPTGEDREREQRGRESGDGGSYVRDKAAESRRGQRRGRREEVR